MTSGDNGGEEEDLSRLLDVVVAGRRKRDQVQTIETGRCVEQQVTLSMILAASSVTKSSNKMAHQTGTRSHELVRVTRVLRSREERCKSRRITARKQKEYQENEAPYRTSDLGGNVMANLEDEACLLEGGQHLKRRLPELLQLPSHTLVSGRFMATRARRATIIRGTMRPSWRKLIILSMVTILLTSLLANLNMMNLMPSCPTLFNHCHALSVVTKSSMQTSSSNSTAPTITSWTIPSISNTSSIVTGISNQQQANQQLHVYHHHQSSLHNNASAIGRQVGKISDLTPGASLVSNAARMQPIKDLRLNNNNHQKGTASQERNINRLQQSSREDGDDIAFDLHQDGQQERQQQQGRIQAKLMQLSNVNLNGNATNQSNNGPKATSNNNQAVGSGDTGAKQIQLHNQSQTSDGNNNGQKSSINRVATETVQQESTIVLGRRVPAMAPRWPAITVDGDTLSRPTTHNNESWKETAKSSGGLRVIEPGASFWPQTVDRKPMEGQQRNVANMSKFLDKSVETTTKSTHPEGWTVSAGSGNGESATTGRDREAQYQRQIFPIQQVASTRQQPVGGAILIPKTSHSLLQDVVREALNDLMSSTNEQILSAASASRPLVMRPHSHLATAGSSASEGEPNTSNGYLSRQPFKTLQSIGGKSNQLRFHRPLMSTASASAPSISLPPLSHFLVPRNPFRLFSSSSTPIATRFRQTNGSQHLWQHQQPQQTSSSRQHQVKQQAPGSSMGRWFHSAASVASPAFQGTASLPEPPSLPLVGPTSERLYAHSHSAEQLEQLVRAASRINGNLQPPILPAIVSAPMGPFPGYYIPAIESESESQVQETRHGETATNDMLSKIPGTDYVLHPDEVRAMINIGELAWRKQSEQTAQQQAAGSRLTQSDSRDQQHYNGQGQQQFESSEVQNWRAVGPNGAGGLMQENHAENARDFAYVERPAQHQNRRDVPTHQGQGHYRDQNSRVNGSQALESQLVDHFNRSRLNSFPAIIRVNDQDYIHWPLLNKMNNEEQQGRPYGQRHQESMINEQRFYPLSHEDTMKHQATATFNRNSYSPSGQQQMGQLLALAAHPAFNTLTTAASHMRPRDLEQSPMRLATQLTPSEIRQVEDSIIEALILAQTSQHQRKLMQSSASQNSISHMKPEKSSPPQQGEQSWQTGEGYKGSRFRNGFFGFRRRRNLPPQQSNQNQQAHPLMSTDTSDTHVVAISPILAARPIHLVTPLIPLAPAPSVISGEAQILPIQDQSIIVPVSAPSLSLHKDSRSSQHPLPVLMADQETNKPGIVKPQQDSGLSVESSVPNMAIVASPPKLAGLSNSASDRVPMMRQVPYGNRVAEQSAGSNNPTTTSSHRYREDMRLKWPRASQKQENLIATRPGTPHRINVDWPGMVSDADYFPTNGDNSNNIHGHQAKAQEAESRDIGRLKLNTNQSRRPNLSYVTSHVKLQFAQDYQAREGVPIYNNNVGVPGALDRERIPSTQHGEHSLADASSHPRSPYRDSSVDNNDSDEYPEGSSYDDLQQRGSGLSGDRVSVNVSNGREATSRVPEQGDSKLPNLAQEAHAKTNNRPIAQSSKTTT